MDIVEKESILNLLDNEYIVIACGGGGIPVVKDKEGDFNGVPAIIDKDFASAKLAEVVGADHLFILTAVDRVCLDFGMPTERALTEMTAEEAERWCEEGQFAPGSMLPKGTGGCRVRQSKKGNKSCYRVAGRSAAGYAGRERHSDHRQISWEAKTAACGRLLRAAVLMRRAETDLLSFPGGKALRFIFFTI